MTAEPGRTTLRRHEQYRDRWSAFGARTGIASISERPSPSDLSRFVIFAGCDEALLDKLSPDVSVATWKAGTVLFEEGAYIDLWKPSPENTRALSRCSVPRPARWRWSRSTPV
jgi:hypothetical protein